MRALQYYDSIGLLCPATENNGYRTYAMSDIKKLQKILFLKDLGFSLREIRDNPDILSHREALEKRKKLLQSKCNQIQKSIENLDCILKGETITMGKSDYMEYKDTYKKEVLQRWSGSKEYKEYEQKSANYSDDNWKSILDQTKGIFKEFADKMDCSPSSPEIQNLVAKWQEFITANFYTCTKEILLSLSSMYVHDDRFKNYFNGIKPGFAEYLAQVINIYCN